MTILSELKAARTWARIKLKSKVSRLRAAFTEGVDIGPTSLKRKITEVKQCWTVFEAAHNRVS